MINKDSFVEIMEAFDDYFNGEFYDALKILGICDSAFTEKMDAILEALERDVDPKNKARYDDLTMHCGSFICEWLFGKGEFQEACPTAESLYDYIMKQYEAPNGDPVAPKTSN